jgi:hypothetical protein
LIAVLISTAWAVACNEESAYDPDAKVFAVSDVPLVDVEVVDPPVPCIVRVTVVPSVDIN